MILPASAFVYRHVVCFEETNVVGNVYFARHVAWQGRCREVFLKRHAPEILNELAADLRLVTLRVECVYHDELHAFDEIDIEMRLAFEDRHRLGLEFAYRRAEGGQLVACGSQEIGCMRATPEGLRPCQVPPALEQALVPFRHDAGRCRAELLGEGI